MYKTKKHIGIRIFLLALFLGYFADTSFFTHTHIIQGVTIVHSHYFRGFGASKDTSRPAEHQHPLKSLLLIHQANTWTATLPSLAEVTQPLCFCQSLFSREQVSSVVPTYIYSFQRRGPPVKA